MKKLLLLLILPFLSFGQDLCEGVTVEINSVTDSTLNIVISTVNSPDFWCSYCGLVLRDNNDNIVAIENPYDGGSFYGLAGGYSELRELEIINSIDLPFEGVLHAMSGLIPNVVVDENFNVNPLNPIDMVDGDIPFTMCSWEFNLIGGCTDESACNYDELATQDDGSCQYPGDECEGFDVQLQELVYGILDDNCECALPLSIDMFSETEKIIKVVNVLGQKSQINSKEKILIYIYDDGTVEKKYLIK